MSVVQEKLSAILSPSDLERLKGNNIKKGVWLFMPMGTTLATARQVDKILLSLGVVSMIYVFDTQAPMKTVLFMDQRKDSRRQSAPTVDGKPIQLQVDRRARKLTRGRRAEDHAHSAPKPPTADPARGGATGNASTNGNGTDASKGKHGS